MKFKVFLLLPLLSFSPFFSMDDLVDEIDDKDKFTYKSADPNLTGDNDNSNLIGSRARGSRRNSRDNSIGAFFSTFIGEKKDYFNKNSKLFKKDQERRAVIRNSLYMGNLKGDPPFYADLIGEILGLLAFFVGFFKSVFELKTIHELYQTCLFKLTISGLCSAIVFTVVYMVTQMFFGLMPSFFIFVSYSIISYIIYEIVSTVNFSIFYKEEELSALDKAKNWVLGLFEYE